MSRPMRWVEPCSRPFSLPEIGHFRIYEVRRTVHIGKVRSQFERKIKHSKKTVGIAPIALAIRVCRRAEEEGHFKTLWHYDIIHGASSSGGGIEHIWYDSEDERFIRSSVEGMVSVWSRSFSKKFNLIPHRSLFVAVRSAA